MNTWSLTKKPKIYNGKKKGSLINGSGLTGSLYIKKCFISVTLHKAQVQVDQGPKHISTHTESIVENWQRTLYSLALGSNFLSRSPVAQPLR